MRITKRTYLVQVKTENSWQWLFARGMPHNHPVVTADYRKAQTADGLGYFQSKMGNHTFRAIRPVDCTRAETLELKSS